MDLEEVFDEIEDLLYDADPAAAAAELAETGGELPVGTPGRAAYLAAAAETWRRADRLDDALRCAEAAIADGGPTMTGGHTVLIEVLLARGEHDRALASAKELRALVRTGGAADTALEHVAELFEEAGLLREAHRWFSLAVAGVDPDDPHLSIGPAFTALIGRRRVREALGLPADRLDQTGEWARQRFLTRLDASPAARRAGRTPAVSDRTTVGGLGPLGVLHWPQGQFERLIDAWPELADDYGGDADGHRQATEQELRALADQGAHLMVAPGSVEELIALAADWGVDPGESSTRARYAAELTATGRAVAWPPGRNEPCWCGSGQKYKRCCGRPAE
jgi:tetratricopeptide (TPR) repeat protein